MTNFRLKKSLDCVNVYDVTKRRNTAGYDLKKTAQDAVGKISKKRGMKKSDVVERTMAFLVKSPDSVQSVLLDVVDRDMRAAYADALESMARALRQQGGDDPGEPEDLGLSRGNIIKNDLETR